jgi:hypothetical protein
LINEHLGRDLSEPLAAVYRAFHGPTSWRSDPPFAFYLAVYEVRVSHFLGGRSVQKDTSASL